MLTDLPLADPSHVARCSMAVPYSRDGTWHGLEYSRDMS